MNTIFKSTAWYSRVCILLLCDLVGILGVKERDRIYIIYMLVYRNWFVHTALSIQLSRLILLRHYHPVSPMCSSHLKNNASLYWQIKNTTPRYLRSTHPDLSYIYTVQIPINTRICSPLYIPLQQPHRQFNHLFYFYFISLSMPVVK